MGVSKLATLYTKSMALITTLSPKARVSEICALFK
jgi:hypothetical protein